MSEETQGQTAPEEIPAPSPTPPKPKEAPRKTFSRDDVRRHIEVGVILPDLYPDYEPWKFKLRLKLSRDAEERRQEYLSLSPAEMTVKEQEQNLDELTDLLVDYPEGFSDLQKNLPPGPAFKDYVMSAPADMKDVLFSIVTGATTLYWRKISPREFRR
jgi:hypothetical protein